MNLISDSFVKSSGGWESRFECLMVMMQSDSRYVNFPQMSSEIVTRGMWHS